MATRKLSAEDTRAAKRLLRLWNQHNAVRVERGMDRLTQEEGGDQMGMGQSAVGQFLRGEVPLGITPVLKFSNLLKVDPRQIRQDLSDLNQVIERLAKSAP